MQQGFVLFHIITPTVHLSWIHQCRKHVSSSFLTPKKNYQNLLIRINFQGCFSSSASWTNAHIHVQIQWLDQSFVQPLYLLEHSSFKRLHLHLLLSQACVQSDTLSVGLGTNLSDLLISSVGEEERKATDTKWEILSKLDHQTVI